MITRILKALAWLVAAGVVVALGALAWLVLVPPPLYEPPQRTVVDESELGLGELVGWYRDDQDAPRMVTWGAERGLSMNSFDEPAQGFLLPVERDRLAWRGREGANAAVRVVREAGGAVAALEWTDRDGEPRAARRLEEFGYRQREVRFRSGDTELAGLLLVPLAPGPHPAVAFVHGSGVSDRDNYWYLYQADYLARRDWVVLLPDKRGCGKSGGAWHTAAFEDFAQDALAAVALLAARPEVDPRRVGLLGVSQGGWIAPLAAGRSGAVRFVVNLSGSATTPGEQVRHEIRADIRNGGAPGFVAALVEPVFTRRAMRRRATWWDKNESFDPLPHWSRLDVPILVVYGRQDEDDNVPVQRSLDLLQAIAGSRPAGQWTFHVYDDLGHGMIDRETGWISRRYLGELAAWLGQRAEEAGAPVAVRASPPDPSFTGEGRSGR